MCVLGVITWVVGAASGAAPIVLTGAFLVIAPILCLMVGLLTGLGRGRGTLSMHRAAYPTPASAGDSVSITATIAPRSASAWTSQALHSMVLSAPIPAFQNSSLPLRARIRATYAQIQLTYQVHPNRRGRWSLGPLFVARTDPFGFTRTRGIIDDLSQIVVWPVLLPTVSGHSSGVSGVMPQHSGAADPSDEDSALRLYQPGDDLRRVHWASAARHSQLMVRASEGASLAPACVLIDLLPQPEAQAQAANDSGSPSGKLTEWAVSVAASLAVHLLESGRPTRLLTTSLSPMQPGPCAPAEHGGPVWVRTREPGARALLLDQTIDLAVPTLDESDSGPVAARSRVFDSLAGAGRHSEILICVIAPPQEGDVRSLLANYSSLPSSGTARHALVMAPAEPAVPTGAIPGDEPDGRILTNGPGPTGYPVPIGSHTRDIGRTLGEFGWTVHTVPIGSDLATVWPELSRGPR